MSVIDKDVLRDRLDQIYTNCQARCGIEPGMVVRIARKAETGERGWPNKWASGMDRYVGQTGTVIKVSPLGIKLDGIPYTFPFFVMEYVEQDAVV